jgi:pyrroloquinoline quinone (PQQ) biosynthesis protein C
MNEYARTGALMDIRSYPEWLQVVVADCHDAKIRAAEHELFYQMRDGALSATAARRFFVGVWPVIDQFPQYMALNLLKVQSGQSPGDDLARRYLIRNIRVEQHHASYWMEWAQASGIGANELLNGSGSVAAEALAHWCWHTCERDPLAAAMAAANYAIEGATGEWSALVCSADIYESGFEPSVRKQAMRWLKAHASYDDKHPFEALEAIATILGLSPSSRDVARVETGIRTSYNYMCMTLDDCLTGMPVKHSATSVDRVRAA